MNNVSYGIRVCGVSMLSLVTLLAIGCGQSAQSSRAESSLDDSSTDPAGEVIVEPLVREPVTAVDQLGSSQAMVVADDVQPRVSDGTRGLAARSKTTAGPTFRFDEALEEETVAMKSGMQATASTKLPARTPASAAMQEMPPLAETPPLAMATSEPFEHLPAGSTKHAEEQFARVKVFYATDRATGAIPLSSYRIAGELQLLKSIAIASVILYLVAVVSWWTRRRRLCATSMVGGVLTAAASVALFFGGQTSIEKHGVNYNSDRGMLARGVCEVTVPIKHQRGMVERPSLLRFEFREDQNEHIVLTKAVEVGKDEFYQQLASTVGGSPQRDLLVFIHGYNVDFESAVQRTAQISVDLPFEGVPVCYSWPSQGKLLSYSIDENNAQWTVTHLREFLLELASESGADSINVVAHSMGNRAMTIAMQQIRHRSDDAAVPIFDRVVLAAPDVDADQFRRDLAPSLLRVANQVTLYASSDDRALIASKKVHGYPRAGESGADLVVVQGIETVDVSGIDLSLLGHSYYGDNESMLRDLYQVVRARLPAKRRQSLIARQMGSMTYWQLAQKKPAAVSR